MDHTCHLLRVDARMPISQRIYPRATVEAAVAAYLGTDPTLRLGELDSPDQLTISLGQVSHRVAKVWLDGDILMATVTLIESPMGQIARTLLDQQCKLGLMVRGSGFVSDDGVVSGFEMAAVDIVARPVPLPELPIRSVFGLSSDGTVAMRTQIYERDPTSGRLVY